MSIDSNRKKNIFKLLYSEHSKTDHAWVLNVNIFTGHIMVLALAAIFFRGINMRQKKEREISEENLAMKNSNDRGEWCQWLFFVRGLLQF